MNDLFENFSPPAERNQQDIANRLAGFFTEPGAVLEVGSGSGQHAVHMANALPHLTWQPSEIEERLDALGRNIARHAPRNVVAPVLLDLNAGHWPVTNIDYGYSTNVLHIVSEALGEKLINGFGRHLASDGTLVLYGPFLYNGEFTTPSNAQFDLWLKERDAQSGIRDIEWVCLLANRAGLRLVEDISMPANNQMLVFKR